MRLLTRVTDALVERLVPKSAGGASCEPDVVCTGCFDDGTMYCCSWRQDCVKTCNWRGC